MPRYCKIMLAAAMAAYYGLFALNNLFDYSTNFSFVAHVLKMDSIFANSPLMYRALGSPLWHHLCYALIIACEWSVALLTLAGTYCMLRKYRANDLEFAHAKRFAYLGLTLGLCLMIFGFLTIGGEWFLMWQSQQWSGMHAAFRIGTLTGMVLLLL